MNTTENRTGKTKNIIIGVIMAAILLGGGIYAYMQRAQDSAAAGTTTASSINLESDDENIDWSALPTKQVTLTNDTFTITSAGTYVLSGTTTAGVVVNTDANVRIALNNATIKNSNGAAIYIESADNTVIQLTAGTKNTVEDSSTRSDETIDGAIYSADDLIFNGTGSLNVTSHFADAIVSKDDLKMTSGTYTIDSADDGIRGKDSTSILGGTMTINAVGDGIKATNDVDAAEGFVYISGGDVIVTSGDDAIKGEQKVAITGGNVTVESSVEGIEAAVITIDGGTVLVTASDDGMSASASAMITQPVITINDGIITVTVGQGDTDAIDSNGDVTINGGTITITAPTSSIDYDGTAVLNGGTLSVNGTQVTTIPQSQMGGGPMRR